MKKIAFMFAAAALMVACAKEVKTATQEQKDSILNEMKAACQAQADAIAVEYVLEEGAEAIDSATCEAKAQEAKDAILAAADTTNAEFKAAYEEAVKAFEAALNAPAAEAAEAPAEEDAE